MNTVESPRERTLAIAALFACAALWSLNGPLIKLLTREAVPGVSIACYRSLFGGLALLPLALRHWGTLRVVSPRWTVATVLSFAIMTVSFVIATTRTAAASAVVLQYTSPAWVFLLSPLLLREKPRPRDGMALAVAMIGVAVIFAAHPSGEIPWLLVALLSGLAYGCLTMFIRALRPVDPFVVATVNTLGSALILLPWVAADGVFGMTWRQFVLMGLLGIVQFAAPYALFSWALRRIEAHKASLIVLIETILNPVWTYLAVGEAVPVPTLMGGPLILLAVATAARPERNDDPRDALGPHHTSAERQGS